MYILSIAKSLALIIVISRGIFTAQVLQCQKVQALWRITTLCKSPVCNVYKPTEVGVLPSE